MSPNTAELIDCLVPLGVFMAAYVAYLIYSKKALISRQLRSLDYERAIQSWKTPNASELSKMRKLRGSQRILAYFFLALGLLVLFLEKFKGRSHSDPIFVIGISSTVVLCVLFPLWAWQEKNVFRYGIPAPALVTLIRERKGRYTIHYLYKDQTGKEHHGRVVVFDAPLVSVGGVISILYLVKHPNRSVALLNLSVGFD